MKVLLAEDDEKLGPYLQKLFSNQGIETDWIDNGNDIEYYAKNGQYDILILDWMLPGKDGIIACKELRENGYQRGIIILTARSALFDKITGLNCGADDYVEKPFEFKELQARVFALARRSNQSYQHDIFQVGSCNFDCTQKSIEISGDKIKMTVREFQVAELLARNYGQVITRETLIDRVWGMEKDVTNNTLDAYMKLIRKKLEQIKNKTFIHNVRSIGYLWEEKNV